MNIEVGLNFLKSMADVVPLITIVVLLIKVVVDVLSATSLEKTLETNYQRFIRHIVNVIGIFLFIAIVVFDVYNAVSGEGTKTKKNTFSNEDALIYLILVGLFLISLLYILAIREYQENYQRKMIVSLMIPKECYQKYVIKKRILKDKVLLEPLFPEEQNEYLILDFNEIQSHILRQESYLEAKKRRQAKTYEFWVSFNNKRDKIVLGVALVVLMVMIAIGTWKQNGIISKIFFLLFFLAFGGNFMRYQRKNYKAGKLEYEARKGNK